VPLSSLESLPAPPDAVFDGGDGVEGGKPAGRGRAAAAAIWLLPIGATSGRPEPFAPPAAEGALVVFGLDIPAVAAFPPGLVGFALAPVRFDVTDDAKP
jgi:hypothetical protein